MTQRDRALVSSCKEKPKSVLSSATPSDLTKHPIASVLESEETTIITLPFAWRGNWLSDPVLNLGKISPNPSSYRSLRYLEFSMSEELCALMIRQLEELTIKVMKASRSKRQIAVRTWTAATDAAFRCKEDIGINDLFNLAVAYSQLSELVNSEGIILARSEDDIFCRTITIPHSLRESLSLILGNLSAALEEAQEALRA